MVRKYVSKESSKIVRKIEGHLNILRMNYNEIESNLYIADKINICIQLLERI